MKNFGVFDIVGPRMVGPSSSHTAGAARLGYVAHQLSHGRPRSARVTLYGSFATTGRGHGTDRAIVGGILGFAPDDARLRTAFQFAEEMGVEVSVAFSSQEADHPNTARIELETLDGTTFDIVGASIGGGNIEIRRINGMDVSFSGDYPTLLVFQRDRPGVVSAVSGFLSAHRINIAYMRVFRTSKQQDACMVIETDEPVSPKLAEKIRGLSLDITEVFTL